MDGQSSQPSPMTTSHPIPESTSHYRVIMPSDYIPVDVAEVKSYVNSQRRRYRDSFRQHEKRTGISKSCLHRMARGNGCNWYTAGMYLISTGASERIWWLVFGRDYGPFLYQSAHSTVETEVRYL